MEIKTRVLTNPQHLEPSRRETARKNIAAIGKIKVSPNTRLAPPEGSDELDLSAHSVPTPDASGKILKSSADGKYSWETPYGIEQVPADWDQVDETKPDYIKNKPGLYQGATDEHPGVSGFVPAALSDERDLYLKGDGTWGKLDNINNYIESATVAGRTLTLTPKSGPAVTFNDTGDINVIEKISVNGTQQTVTNKEVDLTIPAAANDAKITLKVGGVAAGDTTPVAGDFTVDQSLDKDIVIPAAVSASDNEPAKPGVMSSADKTKLDGIPEIQNTGTPGQVLTKTQNGVAWSDPESASLPVATESDSVLYTAEPNGEASWVQMEKTVYGSIMTDEEGTPILDEEGNTIQDEDTTTLWTGFNGKGFGAERAADDANGNNIVATYATKADVETALGDIETLLAAL